MRIAVIGAGVVGVATAYTLADRGHEVEVYDRRSEVATDTSASTAGLIAPGHSYAWASPTAPRMLLRSLAGADTSIRVRPRADADLIRWGLRFLRECTPSRSRANTLAKLRLARYSQQLLGELAHREGLQFWHTDRGVLYLYREEAELAVAERNSTLLREHGRHQRVLGRDEIAAVEPALRHSRVTFAGAIHDTSDATGDPHLFATALAEACRRRGVRFHLGTTVTGFATDGATVTDVRTTDADIHADAIVLAAGAASPLLTRTMGLRIPVYPAKGYTLTAAVKDSTPPHARAGSTNGPWWRGRASGVTSACRPPPNSWATTVVSALRTSRASLPRATSCFQARSTGTVRDTARGCAR